MKTYDIEVTYKVLSLGVEANSLEEAKEKLKGQFEEDHNIVLHDSEMEEVTL